MRKSSKAISLLLSGLMATSCFSMAVAPVSAAPVESEATGVATAAQREANGHQLVYFQFPDSAWGPIASVKRNAKKWTTNVFCNYYAIYGNTNEVKSRSWEAPSTSMLQDTKGGILYFDITESGQGEMEDGAVYGVLFSTKANAGQADLLQPNTDGYQTCDLYLDKTLLGHTWTVDEPAVVRENTANSQKIDYLAHSDNNVSGPLRKVSTLCAYIDGMEAGTAPKSLEMANALQTYLPNPVNNSSFVWQKIEPVLEKFDTTAQEVYDTYVEKYGALLEEATPYEHVDGVDDLKSDGTLKDVYRYSSITTTTVEDGVEQTKTVKYPWLDLVRERLNLPAQDEPTVTDIKNVSVSTEAVFAPGEAVPAADDFTSTSDEYTLSNVTVTPADETFAYGTEYTVSITATPAEGYQMTDGTGFTLVVGGDGPESYGKVINEDGTLTATYVFVMPAKTDITMVDVDTDALFSPNEAIPGNDAFTYDNTQYTIGDFTITPADETFAYEGVYTLTYTATPTAGYQFNDDNIGISLGYGGDATADSSYQLNDDGTMTITYTFTMPAAPQPEDTLIVAGSEAEIFGTAWDGTNEANLMTKQEDGTYTREYTVDKAYTAVQLKSVKNGAEWIGDETGNNVTFNLTGPGTFTVIYDPETNITTVEGDIVEFITDFTYDTVYAAGNGEGTWLNGASWDAAYVANEMTEVADDIWEIEFTNVPDGFERQIKFCIDGAWTHNFGGALEESGVATDAVYNGDNITFDTDDTCTVKAQLDLTNFDFTTKEGAKFTITITYDEEPTDAPATDAPATDAPTTDAPATDAPTTDAPATDAPATDAPATDAPATDAPGANLTVDGTSNYSPAVAAQTVKAGDTVTVTFKAPESADIINIQWGMNYDTDKLELTSVSSFTPDMLVNTDATSFNAMGSVSNIDTPYSVWEDDDFVTFTFTAKADGETTVDFRVIDLTYREDDEDKEAFVNEVDVRGEEPVTEPATEPATDAPATEAPATEAPATEAPATEAPATEAPATDAPATEAPATDAPAGDLTVDGISNYSPNVASQTVKTGETVTVTFKAPEDANIVDVQWGAIFDTDKLELNSVSSFTADMLVNNNPESYTVMGSVSNITTPYSVLQDDDFVTFTFTAKADGETTVDFRVIDLTYRTDNGDEIAFENEVDKRGGEEPGTEPATDAPATDAPATDAPATVPATDAPATDAPATDAPATDAPATDAPATDAPATDAPATDAPATDAPATEAPATEAPATEAPATEAPATTPEGVTGYAIVFPDGTTIDLERSDDGTFKTIIPEDRFENGKVEFKVVQKNDDNTTTDVLDNASYDATGKGNAVATYDFINNTITLTFTGEEPPATSSTDATSATTPGGSTSDSGSTPDGGSNSGAVQTGNASMALIILLVLVSATAGIYFARKKVK